MNDLIKMAKLKDSIRRNISFRHWGEIFVWRLIPPSNDIYNDLSKLRHKHRSRLMFLKETIEENISNWNNE